jgi:hypothetical protein
MQRSMALVGDGRKSLVALGLAVLGLIVGGCSDDAAKGPPDEPPQAITPSVEIGTAGGDDGLQFVPLEAGGTLYIETFGQGGTHVIFSIRCHGLSERAFINITITNLETGVQVATPMSARPQLLSCQDETTCDRTPLLVMMGGIAEPGQDRHGLPVRVETEAHNQAGDRAEAEIEAVLNTERL